MSEEYEMEEMGEDLSEVFDDAIQAFNRAQSAAKDERQQNLNDRRFCYVAGAMYEGKLDDLYSNGSRPKFEVNKIQLALIRLLNDYRSNRFGVTFKSRNGKVDDETADALTGLLRADEYDSDAGEAYDNAFDEAAAGGIGAWRVSEKYEDEYDDENQQMRITFEPITDADTSVFWDVGAKKFDKSDASQCWVITAVDRKQFEDEWSDDPASWPKDVTGSYFDWCTPDVVYIAEYYRVEVAKRQVHIYRNIAGELEQFPAEDFNADPQLKKTLSAIGSRKIKTRTIKERRVHKYIMSGGGVLEDCGLIAGPNIPIVMVYGKRFFVDGLERCAGEARFASDPQRLKNMQLSLLAQIAVNTPVEKPIFTSEQIAGHERIWQEDDTANYPYLTINSITDATGATVATGPVGYTKPPAIPPALAALMQMTENDLAELLGNAQQAEKLMANVATETVQLVQGRVDAKNIIYMDNFAKSLKRSAQIWLGKARELYTEKGRKMKSLSEDMKASFVELKTPKIIDGITRTTNDLTAADMDVYVQIGPSSDSRRASTVNSLTKMLAITTDPDTKAVLEAATMMNMDGEGMSEYRDYFRKKLVRIGAVKPTKEEQAELEQMQSGPSPQDQYLMAAAEEAQAKAAGARADTVNTIADAELKRAKTTETLANIDMETQAHAVKMAQELSASVTQQAATVQPNVGE